MDDPLLRRILAGDDPAVLVALAAADRPLERAAALAVEARARRTVAVAFASPAGDADRALLLARDHLADDPADLLVAHAGALLEGNCHHRPPYHRDDGRRRSREPAWHVLRLTGGPQAPARRRPRRLRASQGVVSAWFLLLSRSGSAV